MPRSNRRNVVLLGVAALMLLGLAGFYLYLSGGGESGEGKKPDLASTGLVPVRTIYKYGKNNLVKPVGIGSDEQGNIFVTLRDGAPVIAYDRKGDFVRSWGTRGYRSGQLLSPTGVAADSRSGRVYVTDRGRLRLICYDRQGTFEWETPILGALSPAVSGDGLLVSTHGPLVLLDDQGQLVKQVGTRGRMPGQFDFAHALVPGDGGSVYVADTDNARIQAVKMSGTTTATVQWVYGRPPARQDDPDTKFGVPAGMARDAKGRLYVLDGFRHTITAMDAKSGKVLHTWTDLEGDYDGLFRLPTGIAYLGGDTFAVSDTYNDRIQIVRLLLPEENNVFNRNPWTKWLLLLLVVPLLPLFRRKKAFVTSEALERSLREERFRVLAGIYKRLHVLPEVADEFRDRFESGVRVGDFLVPVGAGAPADGEPPGDVRIAEAARRSAAGRLLLARHVVVCADEPQCGRVREAGGKAAPYEQVVSEYVLEGEAPAPA